jgi:hypothetical protein
MTDTTSAAPAPSAAKGKGLRVAPDILDDIKDDLGIAIDDTTNDAWLGRRIDGIWARIEAYTGRVLASPPASFVDDWGKIVENGVYRNQPPPLAYWSRGSVYLRVFPVVDITAVELNGATIDQAKVVFDDQAGKLVAVDGTPYPTDLGPLLLSGRAKVTYDAGFVDVPADLYEVVLGALTPQWAARQSQQAGTGAGPGVTRISVQDVGEVDYANPNYFVDASTKRGSQGGVDPLLGPYAMVLDSYVDWRSMLGAAVYPSTTRAGG